MKPTHGLIRASLTKWLGSEQPRRSHGGLHVSDVTNGCTRAVWHRTHRGTSRKFNSVTRRKMRYGLLWEDECRRAMIAAGENVQIPSVAIFHDDRRISIVDAEIFDADPAAYASPRDLVGHPDILVIRDVPVLYEVKTTALKADGRWAPRHRTIDELRAHCGNYILQGAAYAHAYGAPKFYIYVSDRGLGTDMEYEFDTAAEWPAFAARWDAMRAALNPAVEPRGMIPPWTLTYAKKSYICTGCPATACSANAKYAPAPVEKAA